MKLSTARRIFALCLPLAVSAGAHATDCYLQCADGPRCTVDNLPQAVTLVPMSPPRPCRELGKVTAGRIEGVTRSKDRVWHFAAAQDASVGEAMKRVAGNAGVDCVFGDRACRERRDVAFVAGRSGKAFDELPAEFRPKGFACVIGLPCGLVLSPPAQGWSLRIDEPAAAEGVLHLTGLRVAGGTLRLPLRNGRVTIPASAVRSGATYFYALSSPSGEVLAAGQFSVAAAAIEADVRNDEQAARDGGRPSTARLEALLRNELDWDVMMLTRP